MTWRPHHPFFSVFHFLVENKENQLYFRLFFSLVSYPKASKTQNGKSNFYSFPVSFLHKWFPWRRSRQTNPESLFSLSAGGQESLPARPAYGSHKCSFCIQSHYKAPHLETFSNFPQRWNLIIVLLAPFLAVHSHKQSLQTDEQSEPWARKRRENHSHQFSRRRAEKNFCRKL